MSGIVSCETYNWSKSGQGCDNVHMEILDNQTISTVGLSCSWVVSQIGGCYYRDGRSSPHTGNNQNRKKETGNMENKFGIVGWITYTNIPLSEQLLFDGVMFDSFEKAWGWIYDNVSDEDNAYDDLFVTEITE